MTPHPAAAAAKLLLLTLLTACASAPVSTAVKTVQPGLLAEFDVATRSPSLQGIKSLLGRPLRVHIYDLPWFNLTSCTFSFTCQFLNRLKTSRYHVSSPQEADYWWIPSPGGAEGTAWQEGMCVHL